MEVLKQFLKDNMTIICTVCIIIAIIAIIVSVYTGVTVSNELGLTLSTAFISADKYAILRLYTVISSVVSIILGTTGIIMNK